MASPHTPTTHRNRLFNTTKVPVFCLLLACQRQPLTVPEIEAQFARLKVEVPRSSLWESVNDLVDTGFAEWVDDGVSTERLAAALLKMGETGKPSPIPPRRVQLTSKGLIFARYFPVAAAPVPAVNRIRNRWVHGVYIWGTNKAADDLIPQQSRRWIQESYRQLATPELETCEA